MAKLPIELEEFSLDDYSEDVQDIIEQVPGRIIRWGISIILSIIILILICSYFIRYPEILTARITLTTQVPPISIYTRTSGKINLKVVDNQPIKKGEVLAWIDNSAIFNDISQLSSFISRYSLTIQNSPKSILSAHLSNQLQVGDIQPAYAQLLTSLSKYQLSEELVLFEKRIFAIKNRIIQYEDLNAKLLTQLQTQEEEFDLIQKRLSISEKLYKDKVIAELDYNQSKASFLESKRIFESSKNELLINQMTISQLKEQIVELQVQRVDEQSQQKNAIINAFRQVESQLSLWKQQYLIVSAISGKISIAKFLVDKQFLPSGTEIVAIVPPTKNIYGQVTMPIVGSGKVAIGQRVRIKLDNYPSAEFGILIGRINSISSIPREGNYAIQVELLEGLLTSYNKKLTYQPQLSGTAEIITRNLSILERIFFKFRQLINHTN